MQVNSPKWYLSKSSLFCYFICPVFFVAGYLLGGEGEFGSYRSDWTMYLYPTVIAGIITYWILIPLSYEEKFTFASIFHYIAFLFAFYFGYWIDNRVEGMAGVGAYYAPIIIAGVVLVGVILLYFSKLFFKMANNALPCLHTNKKWGLSFIIVFLILYGFGYSYMKVNNVRQVANRSIDQTVNSIVSTIVSRLGNCYWEQESPDYAKWCDEVKSLMITSQYTPFDVLQSPLDEIGACSYAFNENLVGKKWESIADDVVIIFDSKGGWNQIGGEELIQIRLYDGQEGIYVGYKGRQEFVRADDIPKLKWK